MPKRLKWSQVEAGRFVRRPLQWGGVGWSRTLAEEIVRAVRFY